MMTTWMWALQVFWNLASLCLMAWIWFHYRRAGETKQDNALLAPAAANPFPLATIQKELDGYKDQIKTQIARLGKICEDAQAIVEKAKAKSMSYRPSLEEVELMAVSGPEAILIKKDAPIPTLAQVEKQKDRLSTDIAIDLKSLLKDQLA